MFVSLGTAPQARAQTLTVLHTFTGPDGLDPLGNLILDSSGNLYGTTYAGGSAYGYNPLTGMNEGGGTVFRIDATGNETVLLSFPGGSWDPLHGLLPGVYPNAGVVRDAAGNLYGTDTAAGGPTPCFGPRGNFVGCGSLFRIDPSGSATTFHTFSPYTDGAYPSAVVMDTLGNL
ncbi:MAG TPA: choice-of-anchor tandem repeat GloVer-containing protein [Acidobacteriaceae bacterium]|nr:choice-of-anchor tandem repeat GloVer-containing protein [Acidobacteriaceae bacterium]